MGIGTREGCAEAPDRASQDAGRGSISAGAGTRGTGQRTARRDADGPGSTMTPQRQLDPERLGDHLDRLYRAARGMCGSREDAEDLVQEMYAQILRKPRVLQSQDDIRYLLRALRNTFIGTRRFSARRPQTLPLPDDLEILPDLRSPSPEVQAEISDIYAAIASLPAGFRDAIVAVDLVGLSYGEAARTLRVREATITTRLHRARQQVARTVRGKPESSQG